MKQLNTFHLRAAAVAAAAAALCGAASAQSLLTTSATTVIATDGDVVPGVSGSTFGGTSSWPGTPYLTQNGTVVFAAKHATILGYDYFAGSTRAGLSRIIGQGDAAPGLPGLNLVGTSTSSGPGNAPRITESGLWIWGSSLNSGVTTDDTAMFTGLPGSFQLAQREGDPAPGLPGVIITSSFSSPSGQSTGMNDGGACFFQGALSGPGISTTNNAAWFVGVPGSMAIAQQKGDTVLSGEVIGSLGFISQINASGRFVHDETLSTTLGSPAATTADDKCLFLYTPGLGNQLIAREGASAPGTVGATFNSWSTGGAGMATTWSPSMSACSFNSAGQGLFSCEVFGGDTTYGINHRAMYLFSPSGVSLLYRSGDVAPGTGGDQFEIVRDGHISNTGRIMFRATLKGGSTTTANDEAIFEGLPGSINLVVREGDVVPGSAGAYTFGGMQSVTTTHNDLGQLTWEASLVPTGGGTNVSARWGWDPNIGLFEISRTGDMVEVQPGVFKAFSGTWGFTGAFNNGNAAQGCLSNDGYWGMAISFTDNSKAIVTVKLPHGVPPPTNYCTAGTTANGCNASMSGTGTPSATAGSGFMLNVANVEGQQNGIIFYGISGAKADAWGAGTSFLCVKSPLERTGVQLSGGTFGACDGALSVDWNAYVASSPGAVGVPFVGGETVYAQAWFRDPPSPKTTSLSDALQFTVNP